MNKLIATTAALLAVTSSAFAGYTVMNGSLTPAGDELRQFFADITTSDAAAASVQAGLTAADFADNGSGWEVLTGGASFSTTSYTFAQNNLLDDGGIQLTYPGEAVLNIEGLYSDAANSNSVELTFGGDLLLENTGSLASQATKVVWDGVGDDTLDLSFISVGFMGGSYTLAENDRIFTFTDASTTYFVWFLDDQGITTADPNFDGNDLVALGTLQAIPEPSVVIAGIAFAFLGFVAIRQRFFAKK